MPPQSGVTLAAGEALYFVPTVGGTAAGTAADFRVAAASAPHGAGGLDPDLQRELDANVVTWWSGVRVGLGESWSQASATAPRRASTGSASTRPPTPPTRVAIAAAGILLSDEGAGLQVKANKSGAGLSASFLLQTNGSGRAEYGLIAATPTRSGVADGEAWTTAMTVNPSTGVTTLASWRSPPSCP